MAGFQATIRYIGAIGVLLTANIAVHSPQANAHEQSSSNASYRIIGPEGTEIGWQMEQVNQAADRSTFTRQRKMRFTVDGHDPISTDITVKRITSPEGFPVSLSIATETNGTKQQIAIAFDDARATLRRTRNGRTRKFQAIINQCQPLIIIQCSQIENLFLAQATNLAIHNIGQFALIRTG